MVIMNSGSKQPAEAKAIYNGGYNTQVVGTQFFDSQYLDARTFFDSLNNSIIYEYEHQGFCALIDDVTDGRNSVDVIVCAAIINAKKYLNGEQLTDSSHYIPYISMSPNNRRGITRTPTWDEFNGVPMNEYKYDYQDARKKLLELRNAGRKAHLALMEKNEIKYCKITTPSVGEAKKEAGAEPDETIRVAEKYLTKGRQTAKSELDIEVADMLLKRDTQIGLIERVHNEMRDATDSIHADWSGELTNTIDSLSKMKEELYEHIHQWQVSLYPYEIEPLAQRYIELYKIINVEKIIDEEVLFACSKLKNLDERESQVGDSGIDLWRLRQTDGFGERTNENDEEKVDGIMGHIKPTIDGLQRINKSLTIFLKKFEASLNGLGLYVYYPKEEEQFDDIWHILESGEDGTGTVIKRCVVPGVAKKISNGEDDDVIIPAIVEV